MPAPWQPAPQMTTLALFGSSVDVDSGCREPSLRFLGLGKPREGEAGASESSLELLEEEEEDDDE